MKENPLLEKSLCFAARIVKLYQYFSNEKKESVISKQIIRSGTSGTTDLFNVHLTYFSKKEIFLRKHQ